MALVVASADNVRFRRREHRDYRDRTYEATAVEVDGREVCNMLEFVNWAGGIVQTRLCEACGEVGCESGGWRACVRLADDLLWAPPHRLDELESPAADVVLVPRVEWDRWRQTYNLPSFGSFPMACRIHLLGMWLHTAPVPRAPEALLPNLRVRLIACNSLDVETALHEIERLLEDPLRPLTGRLRPPDATRSVESLYIDAPGQVAFEWPALSLGQPVDLALGQERVYDPGDPAL